MNWIGGKMSKIIFKISDYDELLTSLESIQQTLDRHADDYNGMINNLEGKGIAIIKLLEKLKRNSQIFRKLRESVGLYIAKVLEVITIMEHAKATNRTAIVEYDPIKFIENIDEIEELLAPHSTSIKQVVNDSSEYENWVRQTKNELDDTFIEGLLNPIEELKQRDDEKVFRHNIKQVESAKDDVDRNLKFSEMIDEIRWIGNQLEILEELDTLQSIDLEELENLLVKEVKNIKNKRPVNIALTVCIRFNMPYSVAGDVIKLYNELKKEGLSSDELDSKFFGILASPSYSKQEAQFFSINYIVGKQMK